MPEQDVTVVRGLGSRLGRSTVGQRVGAGLAGLGIALVAPSVVEPTWTTTVSDRERGALLSRAWEWSWGRVRTAGVQDVELTDTWNRLGLGLLVALMAVAVVGVGVWLLGRSTRASVLGVTAVALLAGRVLTTVAQRLGRPSADAEQSATGLFVSSGPTDAGSLEVAAALVLLVALGVMVGVRRNVPRSTSVGDTEGLRPAGEHLAGPPVELVEEERR